MQVPSEMMAELQEAMTEYITRSRDLLNALLENDPQSLKPEVLLPTIYMVLADLKLGDIGKTIADHLELSEPSNLSLEEIQSKIIRNKIQRTEEE